MKSLLIIFLLLISTQLNAQTITVTHKNIEQLVMPYSQVALLNYLSDKLPHDDVLYRKKTLELLKAYSALETARQELKLLHREVALVSKLHSLLEKKREQALVEDEVFVQSKITILRKQIDLIKRRQDVRNSYLLILDIVAAKVQ